MLVSYHDYCDDEMIRSGAAGALNSKVNLKHVIQLRVQTKYSLLCYECCEHLGET